MASLPPDTGTNFNNVGSAYQMSDTPSLDLPAALAGLLASSQPPPPVASPRLGAIGSNPPGMLPPTPQNFASAPSGGARFAAGGMVDPQGMPAPTAPPAGAQGVPPGGAPQGAGLTPQGAPGAQAAPQISEQDVEQFMQQHPQQVQQIAQQLQGLLQSGEITMGQLNMAEQLASVALQNPQMYPQLRQYAIQQGLVEEGDISRQFDPGVLFAVILAVRSIKASGGGTGQPEPPPVNMAEGGPVLPNTHAAKGGKVVGPGTTTSDSVPIRASAGEYIIPAHVVHMKGKEFFDTLLEKYKQ